MLLLVKLVILQMLNLFKVDVSVTRNSTHQLLARKLSVYNVIRPVKPVKVLNQTNVCYVILLRIGRKPMAVILMKAAVTQLMNSMNVTKLMVMLALVYLNAKHV